LFHTNRASTQQTNKQIEQVRSARKTSAVSFTASYTRGDPPGALPEGDEDNADDHAGADAAADDVGDDGAKKQDMRSDAAQLGLHYVATDGAGQLVRRDATIALLGDTAGEAIEGLPSVRGACFVVPSRCGGDWLGAN
jgi:hypothetical protein